MNTVPSYNVCGVTLGSCQCPRARSLAQFFSVPSPHSQPTWVVHRGSGGGHDGVSSEATAGVKQSNLHAQFREWSRNKPTPLQTDRGLARPPGKTARVSIHLRLPRGSDSSYRNSGPTTTSLRKRSAELASVEDASLTGSHLTQVLRTLWPWAEFVSFWDGSWVWELLHNNCGPFPVSTNVPIFGYLSGTCPPTDHLQWISEPMSLTLLLLSPLGNEHSTHKVLSDTISNTTWAVLQREDESPK